MLVSSLAACSQSSKSNESNDYPEDVRSNFLAACEAQPGADATTCARCLEEVEDAFTFQEYVDFETAIRLGTATRDESDKFAEVLEGCK